MTKNIHESNLFQFIRFQNTLEKDANYIPCRVNTLKIINIPGTNLILSTSNDLNSHLIFKTALTNISDKNNAFKFIPTNSSSNTINYNQNFYITYQDVNYVSMDENNQFLIISSKESDKVSFKLIPEVDVYYCASSKINSVSLKDCKTENEKASFDGNLVYRDRFCFGVCRNSDFKQLLYIFLLIVLLFIISSV